jgi:hypothetical protein
MTPDADALYETLDEVIAVAPFGGHEQTVWVNKDDCGTAACFCGRRALQDGYQYVEAGIVKHPKTGKIIGTSGASSWHNWGEKRFGLTIKQAIVLFDGENTVEDLKELVDGIVSGMSSQELTNIKYRDQNR